MAGKSSVSKVVNQGTLTFGSSPGGEAGAIAPLAKLLDPFGFRTVLVGDEPLPSGVDSNPNSKVEWFFRNANMAVFLATPDDRLTTLGRGVR